LYFGGRQLGRAGIIAWHARCRSFTGLRPVFFAWKSPAPIDSINRNQPEHNRQDLRGPQAVEKIKAIVNQAQTCFFCTAMQMAMP
jgi:hypothetical protein